MLVTLMLLLLLSLPGLSALQSPLLSLLWRQGQQTLPDPERASLHLELSRIDELEMRLRAADKHTADRLSLEVRDRFREVLVRFKLSSPLPGALGGSPAWSEVVLEDKWSREVWSRARQLPFSDEQLDQLLYQLRVHEGLERDLRALSPRETEQAEEKVLALRDQRELVLAELSRQTHQLVRGMGSEEEIDTLRHARLTGGHSQQETDSFQTDVAQLEELIDKQRELEEWEEKGRALPDTFHQFVLHNAQKVHKLRSSLSARQRREEL